MSDADLEGASKDGGRDGVAANDTGPDRRIRAIRGGTGGPPHGGIALGAEQPRFSQPVRQILLMLIVLGLVATGGWFAYGRIMSIFSANPLLNGFIFGVFVLGVLTCFWQVGQLIRSVSWIEDFARQRRHATGRGASDRAEVGGHGDVPRLLAPLAALLGKPGQGGGAISTASSRSILDSVAARIDELRDITRYMASLLIFLGLLGTFYGLAITVPAVVETIRALTPEEGTSGLEVFDRLMSGLEGQLGGMGTAFSSSLLGLAGSLVVGLLELFVTHGQNRFYRELEEWMSSFTQVDLGEMAGGGLEATVMSGFLAQLSGQMADLHEFYLRRDENRDREVDQTEARIRNLVSGMEEFTAGILARNQDENRDDDAKALNRIADGQERLTARLLADADAQAVRAETVHIALSQLVEGQQRLIAAADRSDRASAPLEDQARSDLLEARMHLRSIDRHLAQLTEEMASSRAGMIGELRGDMAALTQAIGRLRAGHEA